MSSEDNGPDGSEQGGGQGGQPQSGQPQGGQPAGGQPQGGQPQSGQPVGQAQGPPPQGGQAAGGYQQGRAPRGESIGDIFSKPATMNQIQSVVVFYALVGIGVGIAGFLFANQFISGASSGLTSLAALVAGLYTAPYLFGPLVAIPAGLRAADTLGGEPDQQVYATVGVAAFVGNILMVLLFRILVGIELSGDIQFGKLLISGIGGGIGAAIVGAGAAYLVLNDGQWQPA